MSLTNGLETALLALVLNATPIANIADNTVTSPLTNLYVSLHTADPGETGSQTTSECTYTGYARGAITRNNGSPGWTITAANPSTAVNIPVVTCGTAMTAGGPQTATYFGIGTLASGAGVLIGSGLITSPSGGLIINNGITASAAAGALTMTMD